MKFNNISWQLIGNHKILINNYQDYHCIKFVGSSDKLVRFDCNELKLFDNTYFLGYLRGTVKLFGNVESNVLEQKIFTGSNLVFIPEIIDTIESFYLNLTVKFKGQFQIKQYKPTYQVIINPITNQPVILGQESLQAIKNIVNQAI